MTARVVPITTERCACQRSVSILGEPLALMTRAMVLLDQPSCGDRDHAYNTFERAKTLFQVGRNEMDTWLREHAATLRDNVDPVLLMGLEQPWGGELPTRGWMTRALDSIVGAIGKRG